MKTNIRNKGKRLNQYVPDYIVFDLETTGISVQRDAIIEISAVKAVQGKITEKYVTLVNPHFPIPAQATAVNGITDQMVLDAPDLREAVMGFLNFIEDGILVGHNIHSFDTNFIYDAAMKLFGKELKNDYVDTLYLARHCLPHLSHHTLGDVANYFHISTKGAHRAFNDCMINQLCYEELGKLLESKKSETLKQPVCPKCGGKMQQRTGRYGTFYGCSNFPGCRFTQNIEWEGFGGISGTD